MNRHQSLGSPTWASNQCGRLPLNSENSLPPKTKSGAASFARPKSSSTELDNSAQKERALAVHRFLNPPNIAPPRGYTHVVETKGPSRTIYLSGQLGMTPDGKFAGATGDFRAQAVQCFENIKAALAAGGATV